MPEFLLKLENSPVNNRRGDTMDSYILFNIPVDLDKLEWNIDIDGITRFPETGVQNLRLLNWYDNKHEVKFPWELSRCYFLVEIGIRYSLYKEKKYYNQFKSIINDWISQNPFLTGINWIVPMEAGIRAINWIWAAHFFTKPLDEDQEFLKHFTRSLVQHAEYIYHFPEKDFKGKGNNHLVADYSSLFILSLFLKDHRRAGRWMQTAYRGLIRTMDMQVMEDGAHFEQSIPYHRLVLELYGLATLIGIIQEVDFPHDYMQRLFSMFRYVKKYVNKKGIAPQVGDNDSGRVLFISDMKENDHYYLLHLANAIFDYQFSIPAKKIKYEMLISPAEARYPIDMAEENIHFSNINNCFLEGEDIEIMVNGADASGGVKSGHSHCDVGSIVMSFKGCEVIVDPGSYCYTFDKKERDKFRSYSSHNFFYVKEEMNYDLSDWPYFRNLCKDELDFLDVSPDKTRFVVKNGEFGFSKERYVRIEGKQVYFTDILDREFEQIFHLAPGIGVDNAGNILNNDKLIGKILTDGSIHYERYEYSPSYLVKQEALMVIIKSAGKVVTIFDFNK